MSKDKLGIGKTAEGIKIWKTDEEWKEIRKSLETTSYEKAKQEQAKKQLEKDNNDKQVYYVTEITYDHPLLNKLPKDFAKFGLDIKGLLTTALNSVPSLDQSDHVQVYAMPMGDINDTSEG